MPDEALKILGPLSILIMVVAAVLLIWWWPQGKKHSLSRHGGSHKKAYWLFGGAMTVSALLFYVFARWWFAPTLGLVNLFNILLFAGIVLQLFTAWIPDRGDGKAISQLHNRAAYSMAFIMMLLVGCIIFAATAPPLVHWLAVAVFLYMSFGWYLFLFVKRSHDHYLVYQMIYIAAFYSLILVATYVR